MIPDFELNMKLYSLNVLSFRLSLMPASNQVLPRKNFLRELVLHKVISAG